MIKFVASLTLIIVISMHICTFSSAQSKDEDSDTLKVEIIDKPPSCTTSSQRGNVLKVHYTGYLLDGQQFDSRLICSDF